MRAFISLPLLWLCLACTAQDPDVAAVHAPQPAVIAQSSTPARAVDEAKTAKPEAVQKRRTQKAGRSHDLRRAAMVDIVTRRLAVDP